jgi:DNA-binding MarR family transcriptional regulator/GNAT superfamily N-acetyltransferase
MPSTTKEPTSPDPHHVKALRRFNRFYTQRMGILAPYLGSEFSLTEVRVLYELAHHPKQPSVDLTATQLARSLEMDAGYLSRILRKFEQRQWVTRAAATHDARQSHLQLTQAGYDAFAPLQQKSRDEASTLLADLPFAKQVKVIAAMGQIEKLLEAPGMQPTAIAQPHVTLRGPCPGDMGWVVQQHGEIYAHEYGWNAEFEALVADIVAHYIRHYQPEWERCWIAEVNGQRVGSVFVVRKSKHVAQLRMLILTPQARGLGLGGRLTDECLAFARGKGYKKMVLWTNSGLLKARAIYAARGFKKIKSEPYQGFGHKLVGETWELAL